MLGSGNSVGTMESLFDCVSIVPCGEFGNLRACLDVEKKLTKWRWRKQ